MMVVIAFIFKDYFDSVQHCVIKQKYFRISSGKYRIFVFKRAEAL
jgi:hypothetical protein